MPAPGDPWRRNNPDGIIEAVEGGGRIQMDTLRDLLAIIAEKTTYQAHIAVEVNTGPMLKTIDNEEDALETIRRLRRRP